MIGEIPQHGFQGLRPIPIVIGSPCKKIAVRVSETRIKSGGKFPVLSMSHETHATVTGDIFAHYYRRLICGSVVYNDQLHIAMGLI
jgi:hypothetical protein